MIVRNDDVRDGGQNTFLRCYINLSVYHCTAYSAENFV